MTGMPKLGLIFLPVRLHLQDWLDDHPRLHLSVLLFRYTAKSSIAQEGRLATSPKFVMRLDLPHAMEVRLHAHRLNIEE